jgi:cystathionine gamma-synthase
VYSRISSPTRERAETLLGAIEGTPGQPAHAVLYSSGLAASFAVLARLLPKRVAIQGGYHGTHQVLSQLRRISGGTACETIPLPDPADVGTPPSVRAQGQTLPSPPSTLAPRYLPAPEL